MLPLRLPIVHAISPQRYAAIIVLSQISATERLQSGQNSAFQFINTKYVGPGCSMISRVRHFAAHRNVIENQCSVLIGSLVIASRNFARDITRSFAGNAMINICLVGKRIKARDAAIFRRRDGRKEGRKHHDGAYTSRAVACLRCVHTNLTNRRESLVYRRRKAESSPSFGQLTPRGLIAPSPTAARNFAGPSAVNSRIRACVYVRWL